MPWCLTVQVGWHWEQGLPLMPLRPCPLGLGKMAAVHVRFEDKAVFSLVSSELGLLSISWAVALCQLYSCGLSP